MATTQRRCVVNRRSTLSGAQKLQANEQRQALFDAAYGRCVHCGGFLAQGHAQLAHRVIASKHNLRVHGSRVIDHPLNLVPVDNSGVCNVAFVLNFKAAENHLARIYRVLASEEEYDIFEEYRLLRAEHGREL